MMGNGSKNASILLTEDGKEDIKVVISPGKIKDDKAGKATMKILISNWWRSEKQSKVP